LQDTLTNAIVSSLEVPLTAREHGALRRDVPGNARAYELYLRGNQLTLESSRWIEARDLYDEAVRLDPGYAPAWARLGRVLRVIAKYGGAEAEADRVRAERAFERALALNPDLAMTHQLYANLEAELGRAPDAMVRLLTRARARRSDPELFAGLVTTCRYCGLLDASVAAYECARRLDPAVRTSVAYTFLLRADYARAEETDVADPSFAALMARTRTGHSAEGIAALRAIEATTKHPTARLIAAAYRAAIEARPDELASSVTQVRASNFRDPEGLYLLAMFAAAANAHEVAIDQLHTAVGGGFHCPSSMATDTAWDGCRDDPEFLRLLALAEAGHQRALEAFVRAEGPAVLGMTP
jgi:tetratricopeptide (TPR) repeat protein